jgi:hypothetical protein
MNTYLFVYLYIYLYISQAYIKAEPALVKHSVVFNQFKNRTTHTTYPSFHCKRIHTYMHTYIHTYNGNHRGNLHMHSDPDNNNCVSTHIYTHTQHFTQFEQINQFEQVVGFLPTAHRNTQVALVARLTSLGDSHRTRTYITSVYLRHEEEWVYTRCEYDRPQQSSAPMRRQVHSDHLLAFGTTTSTTPPFTGLRRITCRDRSQTKAFDELLRRGREDDRRGPSGEFESGRGMPRTK